MEEDYAWALEQLKSLYDQCSAALLSIVLIDRWLAVINAASALCPSAIVLLCI